MNESFIPRLSIKENAALTEILISSKTMDSVPNKRIMNILQIRYVEELMLFIDKINTLYQGIFKVLYDKELEKCVAVTRLDSYNISRLNILEKEHVALLMFCFYYCMTSRNNCITFEELNSYFQRSSLNSEHKLNFAMDRLVKAGYLYKEKDEVDEGKTNRIYYLTVAGRHAFSIEYLQKVLSVSQGADVSLERVKEFFNVNKVTQKNRDEKENDLYVQQNF